MKQIATKKNPRGEFKAIKSRLNNVDAVIASLHVDSQMTRENELLNLFVVSMMFLGNDSRAWNYGLVFIPLLTSISCLMFKLRLCRRLEWQRTSSQSDRLHILLSSSSNFSFVKAWSTINPSPMMKCKIANIYWMGDLRCINGRRRRFIHRHFQIEPSTNLHRTIKLFFMRAKKEIFQTFAVSRSNANIASLRWLFVWMEERKKKVEYQFPLSANVLWWWTFFFCFRDMWQINKWKVIRVGLFFSF